ncbi:uracil-DNA glycosylase [Pusillimonas sp.]|uniref:uracil-DNA glycosylase n=1 Tax=Pusillimonas sp. TaxID=3040095 RepID=UPI0037CB3C5D
MADNTFQGGLSAHVEALAPEWRQAFQAEPVRRALQDIDQFLQKRLAAGATIFPARPFRILQELAPADVKVVLVGQDPYHGPGQAQGLAFSVPDDCRTPPSLRNMFAELALEYPDQYQPQRNSLLRWARQGVLLLNTALTVEAHQAGSHSRCGWTTVTDAILMQALRQLRPKVLLLWGAHAQAREALLQSHETKGPVYVLRSNHPSPLSATRPPRPFMGCGHFAEANRWLETQGETGIDWLSNDEPPATSVNTAPGPDAGRKPRQGTFW